MNKYLFSWNDSLPGVESSSNDQILSDIMIEYISSCNYISITLNFYSYFTKMICEILINLYI